MYGDNGWDGRAETLPWYPWRYYVPQYVISREHPGAFSFTLEAEMSSRILSIESGTHAIKMENVSDRAEDNNKAVASFWSETEAMGKDLVVTIHQERPFEPSVQIEMAADGSGCAMLTLVPEFECDPQPVELAFLVDCSGSMDGTRIAVAVRALDVFLHSLPMSCSFNIYRFGSTYQSLFKRASKYDQSTLNAALTYAKQTDANMGGTELMQPLEHILTQPLAPNTVSRQLFVLTDGQVSNTEEVIRLCRDHASTTRVFSVGIGDEVSRHLVQGMAARTG